MKYFTLWPTYFIFCIFCPYCFAEMSCGINIVFTVHNCWNINIMMMITIIIRQPLCPVVGRRPQHAVSKLPCLVLSSAILCRSSICPGRLRTAWLVSLVVFSCHMVSKWWHVRSIGRLWGGWCAPPRTISFFSQCTLYLWLLSSPWPRCLTRFNKIATQGAPQMAVDKEANSLSRVYS